MSEEKAPYGDSNIVRVRKDARYFVASNVPFNDERLSWEARGVMGYLLSKPDEWEVRMGDLVNKGPAGMKVIRRILAELRKYGYMSRERKMGDHGRFVWITTLYESPELNETHNPTILPSRIDAQSIDAEGGDILSTELSNTNKTLSAKKIQDIKAQADIKVNAILENERKAQGKTWSKMPEVYHPYARAFCDATGLSYHKKYLFDWISTFDEWMTDGFKPDDVARAVAACKGITNIHRPGSITWKLRGMKVTKPDDLEMAIIY